MKYIATAFLASLLFLQPVTSRAQLFVDTAYSAQQMMEDFFDSTDVVISNVIYSGASNAIGFFDAGNTNLGIDAGIMITSGSIFNAVGPNSFSGISQANNTPGDSDLDDLTMFQTFDGSVIEFDLVPADDTLFFKYVFGSDEYMEYAGTSFNDVFAFFLTGPGYADSNVANIPGTLTPVTINNVNCTIGNTNYYVCNDPQNFGCGLSFNCPSDPNQTTLEYDGFTTPLPIYTIVVPGETYHVKIGVADASDQILDSGVFLSIESLGGNDSLLSEAGAEKQFNGNEVTFTDESKYASRWFWDFGDGTTSTERNPVHVYADLVNTGYIVKQLVSNFCCKDSVVFGVGNYTAIQEIMDRPYSIAPNPVFDNLQIQFSQPFNGAIMLFDLTGKLVFRKMVTTGTSIDMSEMAAGTYVLRIADGKNNYHQKIFRQ